MSQRLELRLRSLGELSTLWEKELKAGRSFLSLNADVSLRDHLTLAIEVAGAPFPIELPAEVVFLRTDTDCAAGQSPGIGLTLALTDQHRAAVPLFAAGRFAEARGTLEASQVRLPLPPKAPPAPRPSAGIRPARRTQGNRRSPPETPRSRPVAPSSRTSPPPSRTSRSVRTRVRAGGSGSYSSVAPSDPEEKLKWLAGQARTFLTRSQDRTHYGVLDLSPKAERQEVRDRYVELMRRFHPDNYYRRAEPELLRLLEEAYQRITDAYEDLIDPDKRAAYDDEIRNFEAPSTDDGAERAERIRARAFEKQNPRQAKLATKLLGEARDAVDMLKFTEAVKKAKLALSYHPHMVEAQSLLRTLEEEGHGG